MTPPFCVSRIPLGHRPIATRATWLVAAAAIAWLPACDVEDAPSRDLSPQDRASDEPGDDGAPESLDEAPKDEAPTLGEAPFRELVDAKESGGEFEATIVRADADPERPVTLWMLASEEAADMQALVDGEVVAKAELMGASETDEGDERFAYRLELPPDFATKFQVTAQAPTTAYYWMFMMCDEMVENRNDTGPGSLRQAIANAPNGGSVCFDPIEFASYQGDVSLSGEIVVGKDVHICGTGPGASQVTTHGNGRAFHFGLATDASLVDLTVHDGKADEGGLVLTRGDLELRNVSLHSGEAERGGALFSDEGYLWIVDSSIHASEATEGGGIYNDDGDGHLLDTNVSGNTATEGGGIYGYRATMKIREGTLVLNNHADRGGGLFIQDFGIGGYHYMWGGAIMSNTATQGGGVYMSDGFLEVHHDPTGAGMPTAIHSNLAVDGGGVYVDQWGTVDVGLAGSIAQNGAQRDGGGIYNRGLADLRHGGEVVDNMSGRDGGGMLNEGELDMFDAARIADNRADRSGGGVYNRSVGSLVTWNGAVRIEDNVAAAGGGSGGGGGVANEPSGSVTVLPGTVVGNSPGNVVNLP